MLVAERKSQQGPDGQMGRAQSSLGFQFNAISATQRHLGNHLMGEISMARTARIQRSCGCGGSCGSCNASKEEPYVQTKLKVGAPNDRFEREADRVADTVMRPPSPTGDVSQAQPSIQRLSGNMNRTLSSNSTLPRGEGRALSSQTRAFMEPRFGVDFSQVRLHSGPQASQAADRLNARAFTYGSDIWLGQKAKESDHHLMAHELTHIVQQRGVGSKQAVQRQEMRFTFGGVPDVLDCDMDEVRADSDTGCCRQDTLEAIPGLYSVARAKTDRAISRMASGDAMNAAITANFGSGAVWQQDEILRRIRLIRRELDEEDQHIVRCRLYFGDPWLGEYEGNVDARRHLFCRPHVGASAEVGGNRVTLCILEDGSVSGGWITFLHEVVHLSGVGDLPGRQRASAAQRQRGEFETYEHERDEGRFPNQGSFSLRNADSYAHFIRQIGAASWSAESTPAGAPLLSAGPALSLSDGRLGAFGRAEWIPLGSRHVQWLLGFQGIGLTDATRSDGPLDPDGTRAFVGAETGVRFLLGHGSVMGVVDLAGGGGMLLTRQGEWAPATSARAGLGLRWGSPSFGGSAGVEIQTLFNFAREEVRPAEDLIPALRFGLHWGGNANNPR